MRYLITTYRTGAELVLGYDARGLLNELLLRNVEPEHIDWTLKHAPIREAEIATRFPSAVAKVSPLDVTFEDFYGKYRNKVGKKEAFAVWSKLPLVKRQQAFDYIERYQNACARDRVALMYPATYLRAERWLDHT